MTEKPSTVERIRINPSAEDIGGLERYLEVADLPDGRRVSVKIWTRCEHVTKNPEDLAFAWVVTPAFVLGAQDWCALFDWWAVNKWAMEGDEQEDES